MIGQPDLVSASPGRSATQLRDPNNAILDATGNLWVADTFNDRVLEFAPPFTNGMSASLVLASRISLPTLSISPGRKLLLDLHSHEVSPSTNRGICGSQTAMTIAWWSSRRLSKMEWRLRLK